MATKHSALCDESARCGVVGNAEADPTVGSQQPAAETMSPAFRDARQLQGAPPPYPYGWYVVAFSTELKRSKLLTRRFMDREIVLYRTRSGLVRAIEAYCPHLGAHFGHGGKVLGEDLVCPFHGFRFSPEGNCNHSPYGAAPPAARLGTLPVRELSETVLVWHGPPDVQPWEVELPEDNSDWTSYKYQALTFRTHPQEVTENSVDIGHLRVLHRFNDVNLTEPLIVDGPRLRTSYTFKRSFPLLPDVHIRIRVRVDGLGFSLVELSLAGGWALRQLILPTPINEKETTIRVGTAVKRREGGRVAQRGWKLLEALVGRVILFAVVHEVNRDREIWKHKAYLGRPAIAAGDGPIPNYRRWTRQFYSNDWANQDKADTAR